MYIHEFFPALRDYIKRIDVPKRGTLFRNASYLTPIFPIFQVPDITTPFCVVFDYGGVPHSFNPHLSYQQFGVGLWFENITDQFGDTAIKEYQAIEHYVYDNLLHLTRLSGKKIVPKFLKKTAFTVTYRNFPCVLRGWAFSVPLEV